MKRIAFQSWILAFFFVSSAANAGLPPLRNLTSTEADRALDNLGAILYFRSVEPVSSNGTAWGFGFGVVVSATTMTQINDVTHQSGGVIPAGDFAVTLQAPLGLALETGFIPKIKIDTGSVKRASFNIKWTWTDVFTAPVHSAVRVGYGATSLAWRDPQSSADYSAKAKFTQFQLSGSVKLAILEPYVGLGLITQRANASVTGTTPLANAQYSYGRKSSTFWMSGGAELKILALSFGGQIDRAFGETSLSLRFGIKI